jgi:hypothetical protein
VSIDICLQLQDHIHHGLSGMRSDCQVRWRRWFTLHHSFDSA